MTGITKSLQGQEKKEQRKIKLRNNKKLWTRKK